MTKTEFLSLEWIAELGETLADVIVGEQGGRRTALGQLVRRADGSSVGYTVTFGGGLSTDVTVGTDTADVTLIEDLDTAMALTSGAPAGDLLAKGKIKLHGDANALLSADAEFALIAEALSAPSTSKR